MSSVAVEAKSFYKVREDGSIIWAKGRIPSQASIEKKIGKIQKQIDSIEEKKAELAELEKKLEVITSPKFVRVGEQIEKMSVEKQIAWIKKVFAKLSPEEKEEIFGKYGKKK